MDTGYYETFNRENVTLVDIADAPITGATATGLTTSTGSHDLASSCSRPGSTP